MSGRGKTPGNATGRAHAARPVARLQYLSGRDAPFLTSSGRAATYIPAENVWRRQHSSAWYLEFSHGAFPSNEPLRTRAPGLSRRRRHAQVTLAPSRNIVHPGLGAKDADGVEVIKPRPPAPTRPPSRPASQATTQAAAQAPAPAAPEPAPAAARISLVLIDDNRLLREGLAAMIHRQPGFRVLAASADVEEALRKVRESSPDVVLLDFGLVDHDSLSLTATVHAEVPEAKVIVMGLLAMQEDVADYVRAGASGFIMKDASFEDFFSTIRAVAGGAQILPQALTQSLFSQIARKAGASGKSSAASKARILESVRLTARERQVIDLLSEGLSNKEIAQRLHIAVHTVKSHVHNVLEKLALHSRLEVAAFSHASRNAKDFTP
ncbi:MAG: response regulator transcription factor [Gemmatimonadetes bacterium]|nr:response regulator transcription factor [Gemmatimonadota bacterium]